MKGHLSKAFRKVSKRDLSRMQMVIPRHRNRPKSYNLEETNNIASGDENSVHYVRKIHHVNPLKVEMKVNNQNSNFEVDTGWSIAF